MKELFPRQAEYLEQSWNGYKDGRRRSLNGSETGTGKTAMYVQNLSRIALDVERRFGKQPTIWLFTVRQDKKQQMGEIAEWDLRQLSTRPNDVYLIDGTASERETQLELVQWIRPKWVILNYEQAKIHLEQILELFQRGTDLLCCNEGDLNQNPNSDRSLATQALGTLAHYVEVATATPIPNKPDSLYPLLKILSPKKVESVTRVLDGRTVTFPHPKEAEGIGSHADFIRMFCYTDDYGRVQNGIRNLPTLQRILKDYYGLFIVTKEEVGIQRSENRPLYVELTPESRKLYEGIKQGVFHYVDQLEGVWDMLSQAERQEEISHILVQLNLARRAASLSPIHYSRLKMERKLLQVGETLGEKFELPPFDSRMLAKENAKVTAVVNLVHEFVERGDKGGVYVHSEWTDVLDEVEQELKRTGLAAKLGMKRLDGAGTANNTEQVRLAVKYGNCKLVLASNAGGRGLNLQSLNTCIFLVPPWSPWVLSQGAGRIERIGQENETVCYYVLAQDTIDTKKMWQTVTAKEKTNQHILHGERGRKGKSILDISSPRDIKDWL